MYKNIINQNDCANQPLTHIHHDASEVSSQQNKQSIDFKKILGIIVLIITIISYIAGILGE
jgi:hypothetical protein